jgi:hypothetical protein
VSGWSRCLAGRGLCPSCGGKRTTDLAAHSVDRVIPRVPVRQWVLSLPHEFRYRLAYDHERMRAVFGLFVRAVLGFYTRKAKARGLRPAQTGAMTFVQRFGSAANLHVHAHVLVMDGVFTPTADSTSSLPASSCAGIAWRCAPASSATSTS